VIDFDAETHTYRVAGVIVPSVTQALRPIDNFDRVPPDVLEAARRFGTHVHTATDLYDRDMLDEAELDPALVPYLNGWKRFLEETRCTVISSEQQVYHAELAYAGTLDRRIFWKRSAWLLDLKSGAVPRSAGPQTAAYREALPKDERPRHRAVLQLLPNNYRFIEQTNPADWSIFLSCLNITRFLSRSKGVQSVSHAA
jgi:hypothetical protein